MSVVQQEGLKGSEMDRRSSLALVPHHLVGLVCVQITGQPVAESLKYSYSSYLCPYVC